MDPQHLLIVRSLLVGKDPFDVEKHAGTLRYYVDGAPYKGTAGVDIALWDIIGKVCGQPLYKLWGGARDKVAAYVPGRLKVELWSYPAHRIIGTDPVTPSLAPGG